MEKEQFLQLLQEQQSSGLFVQTFCEQHNIPLSSFYFWKRKFGDSSSAPGLSDGDLVPISVRNNRPQSALVSGVSIHLPNGIDVEFGSSDDKIALQMLTSICTRYV